MGKITIGKKAQETAEQTVVDSITDSVGIAEQTGAIAETWDDPAVIREDETLATANSRHFVMNNGTAKTVFSAAPMNFYDETQRKWRPIDNSLKAAVGGYEAKFGKYKAHVADADGKKAVEINGDGISLSWEYLGKSPNKEAKAATARTLIHAAGEAVAAPAVRTALTVKQSVDDVGRLSKSSEAVYENADVDTDIQYRFQGNNVKENIIVKERADEYRYLFALDTKGLTMRLSEDNKSIELCSGDGEEQKVEFTIPGPIMYDAKGVVSDDVYYEIDGVSDGKYTFAVVADSAWINELGRAFPVTIDPQIVLSNSSVLSYVVYRKYAATGTDISHWSAVARPFIKAAHNSDVEYRTNLTIYKNMLKLNDLKISNVRLILKPVNIYRSGNFNIEDNRIYIGDNDFSEKAVDITELYKNSSSNIYIEVNTNSSFDVDFEPTPVLEIDVLINEGVRPVTYKFDIAGCMEGNYNVATADVTALLNDVSGSDSVLDFGISHIYKKSSEDFGCGKNFRLNLNETLVKNGDSVLNVDYIYTDANGDKHGFKDTFYYIDKNGEKKVISDKSSITVGQDGKLSFTAGGDKFTVRREQRTDTGLSAIIEIDGYKYSEYVDQRSDEYKQLANRKRSYSEIFDDTKAMWESTGAPLVSLNNYLTKDGIEDFLSIVNDERYLLCLSGTEGVNYRTLVAQKNSLDYQLNAIDVQYQTVKNQVKTLYYQMENLKTQKKSIEIQKTYNQKSADKKGINVTKDQPDGKDYEVDYIINLHRSYCEQISGIEIQITDIESQIINLDKKEAKKYGITVSADAEKNITDQKSLLDSNKTSLEQQRNAITAQISIIKSSQIEYIEQLNQYFKEYINIDYQLTQMEAQMPVNYLTDGKIIKGFNKVGKLVAIFDKYENQMTVEYNDDGKIARVFDGENKQIVFDYNKTGLMQSITDTRGRRIRCNYDNAGYLTEINLSNGKIIDLSYNDNGNILKVTSSDKLSTVFSYRSRELLKITHKSDAAEIMPDGTAVGTNDISTSDITFSQYVTFNKLSDGEIILTTVIEENGNKKYYEINNNGNVVVYCEEENGKVVKAEKYNYEPYKIDDVHSFKPEMLYKKPYNDFATQYGTDAFSGYEYDTVEYDVFGNVYRRSINSGVTGSTDNKNTLVKYEYDDNHRCIKETEIVRNIKNSYTQVITYNYNAAGDIVRKESYIENEQLTRGVDIEETEYDEKGNVLRNISYNSLDSSSKFYKESEYNEQGQTVADIDESGENRTEYEYIPGTNVVRSKKLPNGSKFSYGHDIDDTVTSITQSTDDGEGNSTQTTYTFGLPTQHISGNNKVRYSYDHKRRIKTVNLNGADYIQNTYTDGTGTNNDTVRTDFVSRDGVKFDRVTVTKNKRGDILSVETAEVDKITGRTGTEVYSYNYEYDNKNRVTKIKCDGGDIETYSYDDHDRQTKHTFGNNTHETSYNAFGNVSTDTIKFNNSETDKLVCSYTYTDDSARELKTISVSDYTEEYEQDCLGRKKQNSQTLGGITYTQRYGYYKAGDHATNRVNTIYYGKNGKTDGKTTYTYDNLGNITSVNIDGKQRYKYGFDKVGRLISEKDIKENREMCYTYDDSGNILTKSVNGVVTDYRYADGTDRLMSFGNETFEYDGMGNPTKYRGLDCAWEKGRQLKQIFDGATVVRFTYDVFGTRTSKTVGNLTKNYIYENGKLLRQTSDSGRIDFIYGKDGMIGFKTGKNGTINTEKTYLYRKNIFGDVMEIYDQNGNVVGKYSYSAFGECKIELDTDGIAMENPIRYRGYYYDSELKLYYLKSRYYDPEVGRFITIDDLSYLDPESINGLNLYAYCGNDPVMNVDPDGRFFLTMLSIMGALAFSSAVSGLIGGITEVANGGSFWHGFVGGAVSGAISAVGIALGLAIGGVGGILFAGAFGLVGGFVGSVVQQGISNGWDNIDYISASFAGLVNGVGNIVAFGITIPIAKGVGAITGNTFMQKFVSALKFNPYISLVAGGVIGFPYGLLSIVSNFFWDKFYN